MGYAVFGGAVLQCSFGMAPSVLNVLPAVRVTGSMPMATIMDQAPMVNIMPFGMCSSIANPTVAAATAAAMGVLTPQPCALIPAGAWIPVNPGVLIGGQPCLTRDSSLICGNGGGTIRITSPGQVKTGIK